MAEFICTHCGWEGERKKRLRGSKAVEVLIWSTILIPGPIYSLWRRSGRVQECPNCGLPMLVKVTSGEGELAWRRFDIELGIVPKKKAEDKPDDRIIFGNDKPAETPQRKKPVDPDEW